MSTSSKRLKGVVRISTQYNQPWRGFTLQRGHFYGQTESGVFFVSGLDKNSRGEIKAYLCAVSLYSDTYKWKAYWLSPDSQLAHMLIEAVPKRKALGIDKVEFKPASKETIKEKRVTCKPDCEYEPIHVFKKFKTTRYK